MRTLALSHRRGLGHGVLLLVVAACWSLGAVPAQAQLVWDLANPGNNPANGYTITQITSNNGLRVGDKLFDNFAVIPQTATGVPDPSNIFIKGFVSGIDIGLEFNGLWIYSGSGANVTQNISWDVTADNPFQIIGAEFDLTGFSVTGSGFVNIVEDIDRVLPQPTLDIANLLVGSTSTFDSADWSTNPGGATKIHVVKDIIVGRTSSELAGTAQLTQFRQTFVQVPEPGTLVLAAAGLALMAGRRRKAC